MLRLPCECYVHFTSAKPTLRVLILPPVNTYPPTLAAPTIISICQDKQDEDIIGVRARNNINNYSNTATTNNNRSNPYDKNKNNHDDNSTENYAARHMQ